VIADTLTALTLYGAVLTAATFVATSLWP